MSLPLPDPGSSVRTGAIRWRVSTGAEGFIEAARGLRCRARRAPEHPGLEILKDGDHVFWGRLRVPGGDWFIKGYSLHRPARLLKSVFRASPLRIEWMKTWWLREQGIHTVEPVAVGDLRRFGVLRENFFVCRWIEGALPLVPWLEAREGVLSRPEFRRLFRRMAFLAGQAFGTLHARGALHRQFHDRNLLVRIDPAGGPSLVVIDASHLSVLGQVTPEDRDWNFFQLAWHLRRVSARWKLGRGDVLCFLHGYVCACPTAAADFHTLARRILSILPREALPERPRREEFASRVRH